MTITLKHLAVEINRREIALALLRREIECLHQRRQGIIAAPHETPMAERIRQMIRERMAAKEGETR
jgi:hypothetical protein